MKIKEGIILSKAGDSYYLVDSGDIEKRLNGMIKLNKTGADISRLLMVETDFESVVDSVTKKYDVSKERAEKNVRQIIDFLTQNRLLEK